MKLKNILLLTVFLGISSLQLIAQNQSPEVSNVSFSQRTDGTFIVDVYYDVNDLEGDIMTVTMQVSSDNGTTWDFSCNNLIGDVGTNITSGTVKHIEWDFGTEHSQTFSDQFKIKIIADDAVNNTGNANFTIYVALGNGNTAGYQSGALYQSAQIYSYVNLLANKVSTNFEIPLISDPGLGGRMEIQSLDPLIIYVNPETGQPLNSDYPAPYNNLGVPGASTYDILYATSSTTCYSYLLFVRPNTYFDLILRNNALNLGTPLQQALVKDPTFITLWIGSNDILGYATSGGMSPSSPTPSATFQQLFGGIAQSLAEYSSQASSGIVIANIFDVSVMPFFTTLGPAMAIDPNIPWGSLPLGFVYQKAGESGVGSGSAFEQDLLTGNILVLLTGSSYVSLLGQPTGKYYRDNNFPLLPAGVDTTKPFGFDPQNPFPNACVLDASEIIVANNAISAYNSIIAERSQNFGFGLVDVNSKFNQFRQNDVNGTVINGITFRTTYISGGLFSLDGVNPSSRAHGIIANEFINVINTKYVATIPLIDVSTIPESIIILPYSFQYINGFPIIPADIFKHLLY